MKDHVRCVSRAGADCGESPVWSAAASRLWWVDITGARVHCYDPKSSSDMAWDVPEEVGAVVLRAKGGLILTLQTGIAVFDPRTGGIERMFNPHAGEPELQLNDAKCDSKGRLWVGSLHMPIPRQPFGALFRIDPDFTCHRMADGFRCANGPDWSPDGRKMYVGDSIEQTIYAYDYDLENGKISNRSKFAVVPPDLGRPDGITVDSEGFIWSAHAAGGRITRYKPDGTVDRVLDLPTKLVTNCSFGGKDLDTLYITTGRWSLSAEELIEQPLAGGLFVVKVGVRGRLPNRFSG